MATTEQQQFVTSLSSAANERREWPAYKITTITPDSAEVNVQ